MNESLIKKVQMILNPFKPIDRHLLANQMTNSNRAPLVYIITIHNQQQDSMRVSGIDCCC